MFCYRVHMEINSFELWDFIVFVVQLLVFAAITRYYKLTEGKHEEEQIDLNGYNILLYGETGAGKSTFINALHSYLKYSELETALESKVLCQIPIKFVWENNDYDKVDVEFGSDRNENLNLSGESSTQNVKIYNCVYKNNIFRFLDTPGSSDTRGYEMDVENRKKIIAFFRQRFQYLHTVCILMKPDETRETVKFRYNIKRILSLFHKNICKNIVFLFTHSAGTDFKPKTTNAILQNVFKEIQAENDCVIPFNKANCFYIDNDCFRYLIALKLGADTPDSVDIYSQYWNKSVSECIRLLEYVQTLKPDPTQLILSIDTAILKLDALHHSLESNTKEIEKYRMLINKENNKIDICMKNIERLRARMYDVKIFVRPGPYHMICVNRYCKKGDVYGRNGKACCPNCIAWVKSFCFVYDSHFDCKICGCSAKSHEVMRIPNFEEKEKHKNFQVISHIKDEENQLNCHKDKKGELERCFGEIISDRGKTEDEISKQFRLMRRYGLCVYNKECMEQLGLEISNCTDENIRERLKSYLKTYKELYERYVNIKRDEVLYPYDEIYT